jgi:hypothetical protein
MYWDIDIDDFKLPSNMLFGYGSEFDDTSIEALLLEEDSSIRWVIFRVISTWYVMEQSKLGDFWIENWTIQMNSDIEEVKIYALKEALQKVLK